MNSKSLDILTNKIKRNAPSILSYVASAGVIVTGVLVAKETMKISKLKEQKEKEKGSELTKTETLKICIPVYIPSILIGTSTIACILGANVLNKKKQEALVSAYMLLSNSYKEYREKTCELFGTDADSIVREEIMKDHLADEIDVDFLDKEKQLFYDDYSGRYFESTVEDVIRAEYKFNRNFILKGYVYLNELYDFLYIEHIKEGDVVGWSVYGEADYGYRWVDFNHDKVVIEDGLECYIITFPFQPTADFMDL